MKREDEKMAKLQVIFDTEDSALFKLTSDGLEWDEWGGSEWKTLVDLQTLDFFIDEWMKGERQKIGNEK
jgi:hypothetical protein